MVSALSRSEAGIPVRIIEDLKFLQRFLRFVPKTPMPDRVVCSISSLIIIITVKFQALIRI